MNEPFIYYKEQCDYCIYKGKCDYERQTRKFVETISGVESLASGVFGLLEFTCDYFDLDRLAYDKVHISESEG